MSGSMIFKRKGVPKVNEIVTLKQKISLLQPFSFSGVERQQELRDKLRSLASQHQVLNDWGGILREGSKLRILSYEMFPGLDDMGSQLFALVIVETE
jgi:hypothetical protein